MNKRIFYLCIMILLLICCSQVSAYYLSLDAPAEVKVGDPINVSGKTNIPPPDKIDIIFSHSMNIPVEKARKSIQITDKGENTFNVTFETTGMEKGNYKIEGLSSTQRDFSAGSKSLRVVKIIDRSDLIRINSPLWQEFDKKLLIEAKITDYTDNAIQMEAKTGNKSVFGPESIPVTRGVLKYELPIEKPGTYDISFTDYDGYIGTYSIVSEEKDNYSEENNTVQPVSVETTEITGEPTTAPVKEVTTVETKTVPKEEETDIQSISGPSAVTTVSRENPGYFLISSLKSPTIFKTSDNSDWVIEYKKSKNDSSIKVNDKLGEGSEVVKIDQSLPQIFIKVYPYSFKESNNITITAEGADSVTLSDDAAIAFGAPPKYKEEKQKTPFPLMALFSGLILLSIFYVKRRD